MTVPLMILAVCALVVGAFFELTGGFDDFIEQTPSLACSAIPQGEAESGQSHLLVAAISTVIALSGVGVAAFLYLGDPVQADLLSRLLRPLYRLSYGKFFFDQIYNALFVWPLWILAQASYWFDRFVSRRPGEFRGQDSARPWPPVCGRCKPAWCSSMPWRWCWGVVVLISTLLIWPAVGAVLK